MSYIKSFTELEVYRVSKELSKIIFVLSKEFPKEELYSLTDQIRRSSRSVGAQIAEAWGKRNYPKHFVSKLTDADSEQLETQHWIDESFQCGYINEIIKNELLEKAQSIGKMLNSMINKADSFCR